MNNASGYAAIPQVSPLLAGIAQEAVPPYIAPIMFSLVDSTSAALEG